MRRGLLRCSGAGLLLVALVLSAAAPAGAEAQKERSHHDPAHAGEFAKGRKPETSGAGKGDGKKDAVKPAQKASSSASSRRRAARTSAPAPVPSPPPAPAPAPAVVAATPPPALALPAPAVAAGAVFATPAPPSRVVHAGRAASGVGSQGQSAGLVGPAAVGNPTKPPRTFMGGFAQLWMDYGGLQATLHMTVPVGLGLLVLLFVILQSQIDRRDPKLARAPISRDKGLRFH